MPHASIIQELFMNDKLEIQTILREATLSTRVTEQIEQLILTGALKPSDRFPPERSLAEQFGVSRTVIREAVKSLVSKELLVVKPGSGTFVSSPSSATVSRSIQLYLQTAEEAFDYQQVHEARRLFEVEIAGLAAERRTAEDLREMEEILSRAEEIDTDRDQFTQNDVDFHAALSRATHNRVYVLLVNSLTDLMIQVRRVAFEVPHTPARALMYHRQILKQVQAGDRAAAQEAMRAHLKEAEDTMQKAYAILQASKDLRQPKKD
jgi:GntR family transcriptional regulator, transcriptional repressor for pyruvate dehydrogenase complex